jgi:hypothetical protein
VNKRVFKLKTFARWAKKFLSEEQLCAAAQEIQLGQYEADLGAGLCKKRIAVPGQGKSGATRSLVAKEGQAGLFFIAGRQKSDPGTDFSEANIAQAQLIAQALQTASAEKLASLIQDGVLKEICHDCQKN